MIITLKSGTQIKNVKCKDQTRNPNGLWVWANRQLNPQILTFKNGLSILSTEIAAIEPEADEIENENGDLNLNPNDLNPYDYMEGEENV